MPLRINPGEASSCLLQGATLIAPAVVLVENVRARRNGRDPSDSLKQTSIEEVRGESVNRTAPRALPCDVVRSRPIPQPLEESLVSPTSKLALHLSLHPAIDLARQGVALRTQLAA